MPAFVTYTPPVAACTAKCFQSRIIEYNDFLELHFDCSATQKIPLAQISLSSQSNNETYTLKKMIKEPDKAKFVEAMEVEVAFMLKENIWKAVPKRIMTEHYRAQRATGVNVKRHQIIIIWSFKPKRHPDGSLNKYKLML